MLVGLDGHSLSLRQLALMCGLPIGKRDDVIRLGHAGYVVRLCRVIKLMG